MTSTIAFPGVLCSPSSSNSSFLTSQSNHDAVFLSFRGEDTRNNFTCHLYHELVRNGINTYKDDKELRKGEEISPALLKAIEESKVSIIIFSENYASSTWCLDELLKILECKETKQQKVLTVYYKVEPSTIRHQNGSFKEAFAKHEEKFSDAKVQRWKTALNQTAGLCGFHLKINEDEYEFIQKIVLEVSTSLPNRFDLHVAEYPVGIQCHVEAINKLLCIEENDIRMIGIFGIGGIGKTTIAKAMYNRINDQYEGICFLPNVRESSKQDQGCGFIKLQQKILFDILGKSPRVDNDHQGMELIRNRLCCKKILLVLDDVDCSDQLKKLCGKCDWFGSGSRIIITTRDKSLLTKHSVSLNYPLKEMDCDEALKLFTQHAFKSDKPIDGFADLIEDALHYAGGLPLALKVVGSNLYGEDRNYWKSELEKYKRIPEENIQEKLRISYDGLDGVTKKIFLDIACFFKGKEREYVTKILNNCDFFASAGIKKLSDKCLITIDIDQYDGRQYLRMHDLLEDMGKEIVRQESPEEASKRSRLHSYEDICKVLEKNKGTEQIEGILINLHWEDRMICFDSEVFAKMESLRILIINEHKLNGNFCGSLKYLSNELRVLDWFKCPSEFLPSNFHGERLIVLKMQRSMIRDLGTRLLSKNLTSIDFSGSKYLTKISDLSSCSNLEKLIVDECESLVEVDDSIGFLDKLVELNFLECSSLKNLPRSFKLRSLKVLKLEGCTSLEYFPEIECEMKYLKHLWLESTVIQELPSSIKYLTGLERLDMVRCESLVRLPPCIKTFVQLQYLNLGDCKQLEEILRLPPNIREVDAYGCSSLKSFLPASNNLFRTYNFSSRLRTLNLCGSGIVSLPPCFEGFVRLSKLYLRDCKQLEEILHLPPNVGWVDARRCGSLERFHHVSVESSFGTPDLKRLRRIDLSDCKKVHVNVGNHAPNPLLLQERFWVKSSSTMIYPGSRIPEWFKYCKETTSYTNSIEIEIDHNASMCFGHQIVALVLCYVVRPLDETAYITISINGQQIINDTWLGTSMDPHRVWLKYIAGNSIDKKLPKSYREGNNMRFTFVSLSDRAIFKRAGVHLIYGNDNLIDLNIQLSKRYRNDGENDLEPDWNPQQKRRGSSTNSSIMEFKNPNDDLTNEDLDLELQLGN